MAHRIPPGPRGNAPLLALGGTGLLACRFSLPFLCFLVPLCHQSHGFPLPQKHALGKLVSAFSKIVCRPVDRPGCLSNLSRSAFGPVTHGCAALLSPRWVQEKHQTAAQTDSREPHD